MEPELVIIKAETLLLVVFILLWLWQCRTIMKLQDTITSLRAELAAQEAGREALGE
jgi:hypothetical protein